MLSIRAESISTISKLDKPSNHYNTFAMYFMNEKYKCWLSSINKQLKNL